MKHTIQGWVIQYKWDWHDQPVVSFSTSEPTADDVVSIVGPHSFEVEVPDDFNPIPQQVAALEEMKRKARLVLAKELADLDDRISKLTCITFERDPITADDGSHPF